MKCEVGDIVKVREDLKSGNYYGTIPYDESFNTIGKTLTIISVNPSGNYNVAESPYIHSVGMFVNAKEQKAMLTLTEVLIEIEGYIEDCIAYDGELWRVYSNGYDKIVVDWEQTLDFLIIRDIDLFERNWYLEQG